MSHLGVGGNTVERSGWMRLALELPPGTKLSEVSQLAVACYAKGACLVEKIAFLEVGGQRREVALGAPQEIPAGQMWFTTLR